MKLINGIKNIKSVIDRGRISRSGITYVEYSSVETHCMNIMFDKIEHDLDRHIINIVKTPLRHS